METRRSLSRFLLVLGLLFSPQVVLSQSADQFDNPIVNGERALKFMVHVGNLRVENLEVTVFYSTQRNQLNNLTNTNLSRGRPVLKVVGRTPLEAEFVFPHEDFPLEPNKALYIRYKATGVRAVPYPDVEAQIASQGPFDPSGLFSFLDEFVPGGEEADTSSPIDINPVVHPRNTCVFYRVTIRRNGNVVFTSAILNFRMPDTYNIAIAGDSYGAGEGAPAEDFELIGDNEDMWSHNDCHRSRKSGLVRAVKRFIQRTPAVAVDYIHLACTGGDIAEVIDEEQTRSAAGEFAQPRPPQLEAIQDVFLGDDNERHNELNLLLISIGGNNAGFADYVVNFVIFPANAADDEDLPDVIEDDLEDLAELYRDLDAAVQERFPTAKVAISNYPDPTRGRRGRCGLAPGPVEFSATYFCCLPEVDPIFNPVEEYRFTSNEFIDPLNEVIEDAVLEANEPNSNPDWYLIDVENRIREHGFCDCEEPFINRGNMSIGTQGDIFGIAHPNRDGYKEIYQRPGADRIANVYDDFVTERRLGLLLALALEIETPLIPESCVRLIPLNPIFELLSKLQYSALRHPLLQNFVLDSDVRDAVAKRDLRRLKQTAAYKRLLNQRAEALRIYNDVIPKPRKRTPRKREKPSEREQKAIKRLREYVASKEFQDKRNQILRSRVVKPVKEDRLDQVFNRTDKNR